MTELNINAPNMAVVEPLLRRTLNLITSETRFKDKFQLRIPLREAEQISNFSNKATLSEGNKSTILKVIHESLLKSDDETRRRTLRLIPTQILNLVLTEWTLKPDTQLRNVLPLVAIILQAKNEHNLMLLMFLTNSNMRQQFSSQVLVNCTADLLKAIIRCLQAQPILTVLWDFSAFFKQNQKELSNECQLMCEHIKRTVCPELYHQVDENVQERTNLVASLLINKQEELRCRVNDQKQFNSFVQGVQVVNTSYLNDKAQMMLDYMDENPFGHLCISGPAGSGKMSLLTLANELYTERHRVKANIIVVTLESSFDSKNLVGTYVCNETGDFTFKKGPLTVAAEQGMWLVLRNIEETPSDLLSFLLPLIQENTLHVTSNMVIQPRLGFRLCFIQKTSASEDAYQIQHEDIKPLIELLHTTHINSLIGREDFTQILTSKFPALFVPISEDLTIHDILQSSINYLTEQFSIIKPHLLDFRNPTVIQHFNLYKRVNQHFQHILKDEVKIISQLQRQLIVEEIADVYIAYMYDTSIRTKLIQQLVLTQFNHRFNSTLDADAVSEYCTKLGREHGLSNETCFFGRTSIPRKVSESTTQHNFVFTSLTLRLLEQVLTAIKMNETVLLVGETGTGKTTAVQEIAKACGKQLHIFNLNQNTDSADLLGGFKPVDLKYLLKPIYEQFLEIFSTLFQKTPNNQKFLDLTQKCFETSKVKEFCQCMQHGLTSIKSKKDLTLQSKTLQLENQVKDLQRRTKKLEAQGGFIFQFVEGTLIKSMQNGDWVLLDEINLASESILNKLSTIIQGNHILLNERADVIEMKIHPEFRVFMCMNPPYSSAGKKQLPHSLRSKLQEFYVPEIENQSDLWSIIDKYTKQANATTLNEENKRTILEFYIKVRLLVSKQTKRGNIGLRNLCRALRFMNAAIQLRYPVIKAIYDSLFACFASHLDTQMQDMVKALIMNLFKIKSLPKLILSSQSKDERFAYVEDSLILIGKHKPAFFDEKEFILTPSFSQLVHQLASVISVSDFAIILEGPTSAGKTSCINYLAKVTHNHVIRINNHMHTDVQEYLGSYVPDSVTGKLAFQEGILVEAVRKGYWVILDELNLAPSEVLEALNRLLDDNRELHIVETQKVIKAHPHFRIFATQNPTEGYGGRKELSEAFKNRFVMIKVRDVPTDELKIILEKKCNLPTSRAVLMVKVMENLQIYRSQASVFSGKDSTITVRDLLKWAGRINSSSHLGSHVDQHAIATEGFFVLAERSRDLKDKAYILATIEQAFGVKLNIEEYYEQYFQKHLHTVFSNIPKELNLPPIILSKQIKRLAVLVHKCLLNKEPVLLVGETGCGKTTLCQVFAHSVTMQQLFAINCHQNTETSDFIGCMRTRKNLSQIQDQLNQLLDLVELTQEQKVQVQGLSIQKKAAYVHQISQNAKILELLEDLSCVFEWTDGILVNAMQQGGLLLIDEISLANDSVLERLNSVFEHDRTLVISEKSSAEAVRIVAHDKFNMVATMNPGSDFGKKELSPALRNRMTEIWVDSYFCQPELITLHRTKQDQIILREIPSNVDLNLIISHLCSVKLDPGFANQVSCGIFNIICFVNFTLSEKYFAMQRKALSIRDILNMIDFISTNTKPNQFTTHTLDVCSAFKNCVELVIIDGLCLGIDVAGENEKLKILSDCYQYLDNIVALVFGQETVQEENYINTVAHIGVSPFVMPRQTSVLTSSFAFDAQTTKKNLKKLLRAYSLGKPILIEGSPGVGKTSLVENLAKQVNKKIIRVNLSDQTDMMDLLGSEYPVPNADDDQDIQFSWCDGVLLQAIKEGHWFLIDEMNLAQQSILEGLNAILDHRRTVYIPELNKEFVCHPDFFVFACQNPSQSSGSTSGRKTLPKSFLNRFSKIYLEDLNQTDYSVILNHQASDVFSQPQVDCLLSITQKVNSIKERGDKQSVNMRDLSRFLKLFRHLTSQQVGYDASVLTALETCYGNWRLGIEQGLVNSSIEMPTTSLVRASHNFVSFESLHTSKLGSDPIEQSKLSYFDFGDYQDLKGTHAKTLQQLCDCLHANLPVLVVTNDSQRLTKKLSVMSKISKTTLKRILLNDRSDTTQLLGCFEQTSNDLTSILNQIIAMKSNQNLTSQITKLQYELTWTQDSGKLQLIADFIDTHANVFGYLSNQIKQMQLGASRFEWVDSVLVQAVSQGQWAVIENANLCNPSVLDRLNGLFEEGTTSLPINEQGLVNNKMREVVKHPNFRAVFIITEKTLYDQSKDVSKALKNRCLELNLHYEPQQPDHFDILDKLQISTDPASINVQLVNLQRQHDLMPTVINQEEVVTNVLGKRASPEPNVQSMQQIERLQIPNNIREPYPYYLPLLEQQPNQLPYISFLKAQIEQIQVKLSERMRTQIIENQLQKYLQALLTYVPEDQQLIDFYVLLQTLMSTKNLRDIAQDSYLIYQKSKVNIGIELPINSDFAFINEQVDFNLLQSVQKPDQSLINSLKEWFQLLPQSSGEVYCYKLPLSYLLTKQQESRFRTILRILKFNEATIILIDQEKEITVEDDKIVKYLEETCYDVGTILQTPNLVIVPKSLNEGVVVLSQSSVYETLCYLKDLIKLQSTQLGKFEHFRMTKIPTILRTATGQLATVIRQLTLSVLDSTYFQQPYQIKLIRSVLEDEKTIALKDLPAAYASGHSLLYKLKQLANAKCQITPQQQAFDSLVESQLSSGIDKELETCLLQHTIQTGSCLKQVNHLCRAFAHIETLKTAEIIRAMFILPLEIRRQQNMVQLKQDEIDSERFFWQYHLRDNKQPEYLLQPKSAQLIGLEQELQKLNQLSPSSQEYTQTNLRSTLMFVTILKDELIKLRQNLLNNSTESLNSFASLVFQQINTMQFATVSNILSELMICVAAVISSCQQLISLNQTVPSLTQNLVGLDRDQTQFLVSMFKNGKLLPKSKHEVNMKWILQQLRLHQSKDFKLQSAILEHFVQREVIKRMLAEEASHLRFTLPFKMKEQQLPQAPVGKAMDEWTAADKAVMEAEANKEIELNFPSYFDEVQKAYYSGEFVKDKAEIRVNEEVTVNDIISELLELTPCQESVFRSQFLNDRLVVVESALEQAGNTINDYSEWVDDIQAYMQHSLQEQKLKQVMNIADVQLANSYNFYHSPMPSECKLIYQPLVQLQMRLRDITIRDKYESPLINEAIFLSNYMLSSFNVEVTPLMKILTCTEFLLSKLEEWENTYASKRLNSVENEINSLKLLVIRYRKIQILSWRNLLNWKQEKLVREDQDNAVRLAHTVTKQVFEGQEEVIKLLDLCDLYIRDSTLGTFKPRLGFIAVLKKHLEVKQSQIVKMSDKMATKLQQTINALDFVFSYYSQFKPKLEQTISRLDSQAREKVKTLIDIKKWTLQKFTIMKSNIDKTHRQLNKACKSEEEVLIQNVQSLVLVSSRKKFGGQNDQLLSLDPENRNKITIVQNPQPTFQYSIEKQLSFLENNKILPQWPSCVSLQESINVFMERMQDVRALNKKYLQKKAFYDLLKYMKDEGLRPNFQQELQSMILQCNNHAPYFYKAYETYVMLKDSVQSEENNDLKSTDVLRCQGFSQHLMFTVLQAQLTQQTLTQHLKAFDFVQAPIENTDNISSAQFILNEVSCKELKKTLKQLRDFIISLNQQLCVQYEFITETQKKEDFKHIISLLNNCDVVSTIQDLSTTDQILKTVNDIQQCLIIKDYYSNRESKIIKSAQVDLEQINARLNQLVCSDFVMEPSQILTRRQQLLENQVKVFYQAALKLAETQSSNKEKVKADSLDNNSTTAGKQQNYLDDQPIYTIEEKLNFSNQLCELFDAHLPNIVQTGTKIIQMNGISDQLSAQHISLSIALLQKTKQFVGYLTLMEATYINSMAKFAYLTQRVFLYLIYQGFCGQEEEDDPDVQPPEDLEKDGMGMGDGKGGDDNVADQIEHEEQLEGLKNYESDQEQPKDEQDNKSGKDDEDDNDFEMKEDFDGENEDEQKSQQSGKDSDEDDENDQVDDMLDNELWNQNMEDMEEREKEEKKEEERREQDLGDRELQDENIMDQDSEMAEGDHDKKDEKPREPKEEQEVKDEDQSIAEDDQQDGTEERQEDDSQDIGLNNESMPAEPDEEFSDESKSVQDEDEKMAEDSEVEKGSDSEVDSKFEEENQVTDQDQNDEGDEQDSDLDIKNDVNQAVLEDEQIQANEQNKDKNEQANLKKRQETKVEQSNNNPKQDKQPDQVDSQQVDQNGQDLLFNFAQQLEKREQNKQTQDQKAEEKKDQPKAKEVQDPNMIEDERPVPPDQPQQDDLADEYMQDDNAEQLEGKLAADKAQDANNHNDDEEMKEEMPQESEIEQEQQQQDIQMTQQEAQNVKKNLNTQKNQPEETKDEQTDKINEDEVTKQEDLIQMYNEFLEQRQQMFDLDPISQEEQDNKGLGTIIIQDLDQFDYLRQKQLIRQMFQAWQENPQIHQQSLDLLAKFKNQTQHVTSSLCEQLRIVLEPQLSQHLQGDFKTGKRLNMKKVISFIASNYRNDKIWLRRTLPSKRDYKILIAIDDSLSMKESNLGFFSLEASVALGEALNRLEVGKVAVARIRDRLELVQSFEDQYTSERAAHIVSSFDFKHCGRTSADTAMANFVSDANKLLDMQNSSTAINCPFVIVLSDGRFNKDNVRRFMRQAKEKRYLYIFVVLDKKGVKGDQSIMSMKSAVKQQNGDIKLDSYMKDFPFDYYCVVSDTSQLPSALGTVLVQWFSMVSNQN